MLIFKPMWAVGGSGMGGSALPLAYYTCLPGKFRKKGRMEGEEINNNTPGTAGGPGGRDRTLAVKSRKNVRKITFFS